MSERTITPRTYVIVCGLLVLLTVLTVAVSFVDLSTSWHFTLGLAIAGCKAALVVLFFMHALYSGRLTWGVIAVVCFWVAILFGLTLTDYFTRGMIPFMPGH
jgi:cytochrome c oxidase subunit 4